MKGILIGLACFVIFNVIHLRRSFEAIADGKAVNLSLVKAATIGDPYYWVTGALMVSLSILLARLWAYPA